MTRLLIQAIIDLVFSIAMFLMTMYILLLTYSLVSWELPYVPTMRNARKVLKEYLHITKHDKVLDLGSGLGRMVLFFSQYPIEVTGIEQRWYLYLVSKMRLFFHFFKKAKTHFVKGDFFKQSLKSYTIIYAFHIPRLIAKLAPVLEPQLQKGQVLISYKFPYPFSPDHFTEEKLQDEPDSFFYIYRRK